MKTTRTEAEWAALKEEHGLAYLRGDIATSSPESYTLDEMRKISAGMDESTAKIDAAIREEFNSLPPRGPGPHVGTARKCRSRQHGILE